MEKKPIEVKKLLKLSAISVMVLPSTIMVDVLLSSLLFWEDMISCLSCQIL